MKIICATEFGGPEVLTVQEVDPPEPGQGQVAVDVAVAPVLFLDTALRRGWGQEFFGLTPPYVPGAGVAGTVAAVGPDVDPIWLGRVVVASTEKSGGYAQRALADATQLVQVPDDLGLPEAAALLHDGRTALALMELLGVTAGERVLVVGATGGMGVLLVQLTVAAGARVIGTARGEAKLALVRGLGAEAVDHSEPGWSGQVRALVGAVDVVLDGVGSSVGAEAFAVTADHGRFSGHGAPTGRFAEVDPDQAAARGVRLTGIKEAQFTPERGRRLTAAVLAEAASGRLVPLIGQRFPLEQAGAAHRAIEARSVVGKTVLLV